MGFIDFEIILIAISQGWRGDLRDSYYKPVEA